ncbi:MAG: sugar phosphate isomerase/epimerase [Candidatus Sumerlaeota bacterium]|nr:sugar phosphate isomerase/epimerase [Candidatus Sumerlaeota bacterium]
MLFGTITTGIQATMEEKLNRVRDWGMTAWQPAVQEVEKEDAARVRDLAAARGITISALGAGVPMANPALYEKNLADWKKRVDACAALGVQPLFSRTFGKPEGVSDDEAWRACGRVGREMVKIAEDQGCHYMLECDSGNFVASLAGAQKLIEVIGDDRVYINYDPTNYYVGGGDDPLAVLDAFWPRILHGHIKDGVRPAGEKPHEVPVGTGEIDYVKIFGEMHRRGFQGAMVLEHLKTFDEIEARWRHVQKVRAQLGI